MGLFVAWIQSCFLDSETDDWAWNTCEMSVLLRHWRFHFSFSSITGRSLSSGVRSQWDDWKLINWIHDRQFCIILGFCCTVLYSVIIIQYNPLQDCIGVLIQYCTTFVMRYYHSIVLHPHTVTYNVNGLLHAKAGFGDICRDSEEVKGVCNFETTPLSRNSSPSKHNIALYLENGFRSCSSF